MVTEHASKEVILSQFPEKTRPHGPNVTKPYFETMKAEGRQPDQIWKLFVPNDSQFDAEAAKQRGLSYWSAYTTASSTQCTVAAVRALDAGGVHLTAVTGGMLLPHQLDNNIAKNQSTNGNQIQRLADSAAAAKGYDSVKFNADGSVTGSYTPTGSRIPRTVTCDADGCCTGE